MIDKISQIINARWLIANEVIYNYIPAAIAIINGQKIDFDAFEKKRLNPYILSASEGSINLANQYDLRNDTAEANSIAIIPIQDEILAWRTMELVRYISIAESNPNIIGVVFLVNSPGGMVFYTDIAAAAIKAMKKPAVSFVLNMAASAAMWLISPTKKIIVSSPLDRLGSIGTMGKMKDFTRMFRDKLGIDEFEVYADKSTDKNREFRTLLDTSLTMEERTAPIREDLNFVNEFFHKAIQDNLGIDPASEVFTGKLYHATDAIALGLAHEINTFEYAVNLAHNMGLEYQINSFIHSNSY